MTNTTNFIAELIRNANTAGHLNNRERQRLLERGRSTAAALRSLIAKTGKAIPIDIGRSRALDLTATRSQHPDDILSQTLLALAEEIRRLRIINHQQSAANIDP